MSVTVKLSNGTQKTVDIPDLGISVARFKEIVADAINIPANEQRVVLRGRVLKDADVLSAVGMEHGQAVHVVRGNKPKNSAPASTSPQVTETTAEQSEANINSATSSVSANPYMALAGNPPVTGGSIPNNFANTGVGWPMSPEIVAQMMQNPMFSNMVQDTMRNPQFLQQMMQQYSQNPTGNNDMAMQQLLSNPNILQQTMRLMNNPVMMQQMMQLMSGTSPAQGTPSFGQLNPQSAGPFQEMHFPQPQGNPRVVYQSQLQQLREMGFPNEEANIAALQQSQGNLDFAIERLLNS